MKTFAIKTYEDNVAFYAHPHGISWTWEQEPFYEWTSELQESLDAPKINREKHIFYVRLWAEPRQCYICGNLYIHGGTKYCEEEFGGSLTANRKGYKKYKIRWADENKDHLMTYRNKWYVQNRDAIIESVKQYQKDNSEKVKQYNNKWLTENKDWQRKYYADYWKKNKEKITKQRKQAKLEKGVKEGQDEESSQG